MVLLYLKKHYHKQKHANRWIVSIECNVLTLDLKFPFLNLQPRARDQPNEQEVKYSFCAAPVISRPVCVKRHVYALLFDSKLRYSKLSNILLINAFLKVKILGNPTFRLCGKYLNRAIKKYIQVVSGMSHYNIIILGNKDVWQNKYITPLFSKLHSRHFMLQWGGYTLLVDTIHIVLLLLDRIRIILREIRT